MLIVSEILLVVMGHGEFVLGTRSFLDLHSGRMREVSYLSGIPYRSVTVTNLVSIYAEKLRHTANGFELWQLAFIGGPFKAAWDGEPANLKAHIASKVNLYLKNPEISEANKEMLVKDFLDILGGQNPQDLRVWTRQRVDPELSR